MMTPGFSGESDGADERDRRNEDHCPPHHWTIVDRLEDGFREQRWDCQRCGDVKVVRSAVWATNSRRMANTSTWTPEDRILGGEEEGDELEAAG